MTLDAASGWLNDRWDPSMIPSSLDDRASFFVDGWSQLADAICPAQLKTARPPQHSRNRWFGPELIQLKRRNRQLERKWRKSSSPSDKEGFKIHDAHYKQAIQAAKTSYLAIRIETAPNSTKELFKLFKEFTAPVTKPPFKEEVTVCNNIMEFFDSKVSDIRNTIAINMPSVAPISTLSMVTPVQHSLTMFKEVDQLCVGRAIASLGPSSSICDPIPTSVVKTIAPVVVGPITDLLNISFRTGHLPVSWKQGIITPLLKKPGADPEVLSNLRPVSQLPLLSRLAEAIVGPQLYQHCETSGVLHDIQSGFRPHRGTESALIDIREQILELLDRSHPVALILLDLSAAFDTIDHGVLLERLEQVAGIGGTALDWCRSYLLGRSQRVRIGGTCSTQKPVLFGVPQGSALSPLFFNIYMRPLADLLEDSGLGCQMYADDTQIVVDLHPSSTGGSVVVDCLEGVRSWMTRNWLKLNEAKTEVIVFSPPSIQPAPTLPWPPSFGISPSPSEGARDLGVWFHQSGGSEANVARVSRSAHHQLNGLVPLLPLLAKDHRAKLCQALVISKINYCNSFYTGLTEKGLARLQKVQNRAVRLVMGLRRRDHTSEARRSLGWFKIIDLIKIKCLTIAWRSLHELGPLYLQRRFQWKQFYHSPRPNHLGMLVVPKILRFRRKGRSMSFLTAKWWNALPPSIRLARSLGIFRIRVKAHFHDLDS